MAEGHAGKGVVVVVPKHRHSRWAKPGYVRADGGPG